MMTRKYMQSRRQTNATCWDIQTSAQEAWQHRGITTRGKIEPLTSAGQPHNNSKGPLMYQTISPLSSCQHILKSGNQKDNTKTTQWFDLMDKPPSTCYAVQIILRRRRLAKVYIDHQRSTPTTSEPSQQFWNRKILRSIRRAGDQNAPNGLYSRQRHPTPNRVENSEPNHGESTCWSHVGPLVL